MGVIMEHQHTPDTLAPDLATPTDPDFAEAVKKGYEPQDIGLRGLTVFLGGLVVVLIVVLAFIYAVMMALAEHDRSTDPVASPVTVKLPPVYAPLQPSLGFNGDHDADHDVLDADDMLLMRERTFKALNEEGTGPTGRHYIAIATAMDQVLPLLVTKPAMEPMKEMSYPPGSHEGVFGHIPQTIIPGNAHVNDINTLNPGETD
jgi:hypothetical protein